MVRNRTTDQRAARSVKPAATRTRSIEVFILAGGLSTRMGRDKARLRLGGRTLLAWVRAAAQTAGWPVRVVRRDRVARCGPLGGVWTAFQRSRADRLVFLSCDMPFVTPDLIHEVAERPGRAAFVTTAEGAGFPFALDRKCLPTVEQMLEEQRFALRALARALRAISLSVRDSRRGELLNVNTDSDYQSARRVVGGK